MNVKESMVKLSTQMEAGTQMEDREESVFLKCTSSKRNYPLNEMKINHMNRRINDNVEQVISFCINKDDNSLDCNTEKNK